MLEYLTSQSIVSPSERRTLCTRCEDPAREEDDRRLLYTIQSSKVSLYWFATRKWIPISGVPTTIPSLLVAVSVRADRTVNVLGEDGQQYSWINHNEWTRSDQWLPAEAFLIEKKD